MLFDDKNRRISWECTSNEHIFQLSLQIRNTSPQTLLPVCFPLFITVTEDQVTKITHGHFPCF